MKKISLVVFPALTIVLEALPMGSSLYFCYISNRKSKRNIFHTLALYRLDMQILLHLLQPYLLLLPIRPSWLFQSRLSVRLHQSFYGSRKTLTNEEVVRELLELLKKNAMKEQANDVFEICSYVDGLEKKIDSMTEELTSMQNQIKEMQEDTLVNNAKKALSEAYRSDLMPDVSR